MTGSVAAYNLIMLPKESRGTSDLPGRTATRNR